MKYPRNEEQQKFWEAFRACAEENGVRPDCPAGADWGNRSGGPWQAAPEVACGFDSGCG